MYKLESLLRKKIHEEFDNYKKFSQTAKTTKALNEVLHDRLSRMIDAYVFPSGEKSCRMPTNCVSDDISLRSSLDWYHMMYINNILENIRAGGIDYIYSPEHLFELAYYEPDLQFSVSPNFFCVWKEGCC